MPGAKPLISTEVDLILSQLSTSRDRCLFLLGIYTGFRISELLSITVEDVVQFGQVRATLSVKRKNMKGKKSSRSVKLHPLAKQSLETHLSQITSNNCDRLFPFSRMTAHRILSRAFILAKIEGRVSTHSMRKTFAWKVYNALGKDLVNTQRALGHQSVNSTISYLAADQGAIDHAITET